MHPYNMQSYKCQTSQLLTTRVYFSSKEYVKKRKFISIYFEVDST